MLLLNQVVGWSPSDIRVNLSLNEAGVMAGTDLGNKILITKNKVGLTKVGGDVYIWVKSLLK